MPTAKKSGGRWAMRPEDRKRSSPNSKNSASNIGFSGNHGRGVKCRAFFFASSGFLA
jgi:hypothetical protein